MAMKQSQQFIIFCRDFDYADLVSSFHGSKYFQKYSVMYIFSNMSIWKDDNILALGAFCRCAIVEKRKRQHICIHVCF